MKTGAKCCHFKKNGQAVVSCSIEGGKIKSAEIRILHGITEYDDNQPNDSMSEKYDAKEIDSLLSISLTEKVDKHASESVSAISIFLLAIGPVALKAHKVIAVQELEGWFNVMVI